MLVLAVAVVGLGFGGMSTRAIAPIVGSNKETVRHDLAGAKKLAPELAPANVDTETGNS